MDIFTLKLIPQKILSIHSLMHILNVLNHYGIKPKNGKEKITIITINILMIMFKNGVIGIIIKIIQYGSISEYNSNYNH